MNKIDNTANVYSRDLENLSDAYRSEPKTQRTCPICQCNRTKNISYLKDRYRIPIQFDQCRNCGHLFQGLQPNDQWWEIFYAKYYWPIYGAALQISRSDDLQIGIERYRQYLSNLSSLGLRPKKILDVGSGSGGIFKAAKEVFPRTEVVGSDVFEEDDSRILKVDWQSEKVVVDADLIICVHTLEHIVNPLELLRNLRLSNADNHRIYIEVPDVSSRLVDLKNFFHIAHIQYFDLASLKYLLQSAGYSIERIVPPQIKNWPWAIGLIGISNTELLHAEKPSFYLKKLKIARLYLKYLRSLNRLK